MALPGFDKNYYLNAKLAALQQTSPEWVGKDIAYLESILLGVYGLTAEDHYRLHGYAEGLAPNQYFNGEEYSLAKATQLVASGYAADLASALEAFQAAWSGNPYEHYLQFGAQEGLNPSNAFDESEYLTDKLASLQAADPSLYAGWAVADVRDAFFAAGLTPLTHFLDFGAAEGIGATTVPAEEQVSAGGGQTFTVAQALAQASLPAGYKIGDAVANLLTLDLAAMDLIDGALEVTVGGNATVSQIDTLVTTRGYDNIDHYTLRDTSQNLRSVATGDIVDGAASFSLSEGIAVSEYSATKTLFAEHGQTFAFTLNDTFANLKQASTAILNEADSYSLSNPTGTSLGTITSNQLEFVQDAANYERGKWDIDTDTYLVGNQHDEGPYKAVVYIESTFANGTTYTGSGVVVGANDILTVSHLVYSEPDGGLATRVEVFPGRDGRDSPFGSFIADSINYYDWDANDDGLLSTYESESDIALLGFDSALGGLTGWFGLDPHQTSNYYNISGFPGVYVDDSGPRMTNDYGYAEEDGYAAVFDYVTLETNPGNSGGPLWYEDGSTSYVAGLVSTGGWAVDVYAKYTEIQQWMISNNSLLSGSGTSAEAASQLLAAESGSLPVQEDIQLTGVPGSTDIGSGTTDGLLG